VNYFVRIILLILVRMPAICLHYRLLIDRNFTVSKTSSSFQQKATVSNYISFLHCIININIGPACNKIAGSDLDGDQYFVSHFLLRLIHNTVYIFRFIGVQNYNCREKSSHSIINQCQWIINQHLSQFLQ
jgi:hypothetical protein